MTTTTVYQATLPDGTVQESRPLDFEPEYIVALRSHRQAAWVIRTWTASEEHAIRMMATLSNIYGRNRVAMLTVDGHEEGK